MPTMTSGPSCSSWGHALLARQLAAAESRELRDGDKAILAAQRACQLAGERSWFCLDTLAAAFAETGQFEDALVTQQRACRLAPLKHRAACDGRLSLYQAGRAFRLD